MILKELQFVVWTISFFHGPHPDQDEKLFQQKIRKIWSSSYKQRRNLLNYL
ncbi:hypothetical protein glysoja_026980 [Glycine soja]|uniref:Uncharacterized protein n=1 Tax=Glycine soja TaxID=3848 RepID=A0A0B2QC94_GLYSO|nr:hypothetical protein glysoja_026980 [Glycine soja]